jgi:hypothetical protein
MPDTSTENNDEQSARGKSRRRLLVIQIALVNVTVLVMGWFISSQPGMLVQLVTAVVLVSLVVGNGALWLGWRFRQARLRQGKTPVKPVFLFAVGILSLAIAMLSVISGDYAGNG